MSGKPENLRKMKDLIIEYNKRMFQIQKSFNDKNYEDFYVAVQPFLSKIKFEDLSWVSKLDCFHVIFILNFSLLINQIK
jgi:hypothetical protein